MRARLRVIWAAVALAASIAAPALAQDAQPGGAAPAIAIAPPPPSSEAVGPAQLRDFSLQGTVTRRAETPAQPQSQQRQAAPAASGSAQTVAAPVAAGEQAGRAAVREASTPDRAPARTTGASPAATGLPTPDQTLSFSPATMTPEPVEGSEPTPLDNPVANIDGGLVSHWPWLLALLAALAAAAWYFRRQRSGYAFAGADASAFDLSAPPPSPAQRRPGPPQPDVAPPAPRAPAPREPELTGGVVSTRLRAAPEAKQEAKPAIPSPGIVSARLRPWLDIEFEPLAASFNDKQGVIEFDVTLFNSGSAPAREILLEARLFNAGGDQDEVIAKFVENPTVEGDRLDVIQPLQRMAFRTSATVPREQMRIYEAGGRKVWVPLIGFNAPYRWSGGEGQTSASYLLGRNTNGEKMAPFRVDMGVRTFNDLGAHEHNVRLRR